MESRALSSQKAKSVSNSSSQANGMSKTLSIPIATALFGIAMFTAMFPFGTQEAASVAINQLTVGTPIVILTDRSISESSGLVRSHLIPNCHWTHNDSGDAPLLYLFNDKGDTIARVRLSQAAAIDWEDMTIYRKSDTEAFLIVGDIGGNSQKRSSITLYIVHEPKLATVQNGSQTTEISLDLESKMEVTFPGGVTNYESIAFDHSNQSILIIEKGVFGGRAYTVPFPLPGQAKVRVEAKQVGIVPVSTATSCDISLDGRSLVVLTYKIGFLFHRELNSAGVLESWKEVFEKEPLPFSLGNLRQTEAVCFSQKELSVLVSSEMLPTPIVEIKLPTSPQAIEK